MFRCSQCGVEHEIVVVKQGAFIQVQWCLTCVPFDVRKEVAGPAKGVSTDPCAWYDRGYLVESYGEDGKEEKSWSISCITLP